MNDEREQQLRQIAGCGRHNAAALTSCDSYPFQPDCVYCQENYSRVSRAYEAGRVAENEACADLALNFYRGSVGKEFSTGISEAIRARLDQGELN